MKLYAFDYYEHLANGLCKLNPELDWQVFRVGQFHNREAFVVANPPDAESVVLATIQPPDSHLMEMLLLCDTLSRLGSKKITVVLPYLAYSRQDKIEHGRSLAAAWVGRLLQACGVSQVITLDVHSPQVAGLFPIPLISFSTSSLMANALAPYLTEDITVVAPDEGAISRRDEFVAATGRPLNTAHFVKVRSEDMVRSDLVGTVTQKAIVIDDILDTGGTLCACCRGLLTAGATAICVAVTHGLFTGHDWTQLWAYGVERIIITDSVAYANPRAPRIECISCVPALAGSLPTYA